MTDDFATVRSTAADSFLWTVAQNAISRAAAAWRDSTVIQRMQRGVAMPVSSWSRADWVASIAAAIAVAAVVNVVLLQFVSEYAAPGVPRAAIALIAIAAACVAAAPATFIAAWPSSILGRVVSGLARALYKAAE